MEDDGDDFKIGRLFFWIHIPIFLVFYTVNHFLAEQYKFDEEIFSAAFTFPFLIYLLGLLFGNLSYDTDIDVTLSKKDKKSKLFIYINILNFATVLGFLINWKLAHSGAIEGLINDIPGFKADKDALDRAVYLLSFIIPPILFVITAPFRRLNRIEKLMLDR